MRKEKIIIDILNNEKIEYFSFISAEKAEVINPRLLPSWAKNVIVFLIPYRTDKTEKHPLAHFARIRDYHGFASQLFDRIVPKLQESFEGGCFKGFADHSPVNERKLAFRCGLGDLGKNGLILNEKYGSYVFIGEIFTNVDLTEIITPPKRLCTDCGKCLKACPKETTCISEISQKKRKTEEDFLILKKNNVVWGCDRCQEACPLNLNGSLSPFEYFYKGKLSSPEDILSMDEKTFGSYSFSYRGRSVIAENVENILKKRID